MNDGFAKGTSVIVKWETHSNPFWIPTPTSDTISSAIGLDPMQYSRNRAMVWCREALVGLFS